MKKILGLAMASVMVFGVSAFAATPGKTAKQNMTAKTPTKTTMKSSKKHRRHHSASKKMMTDKKTDKTK